VVNRPSEFEPSEATFDNAPDLVCFCHLRWNFVYQRPQHLMSRCARERRVFFFEEPIFEDRTTPHLELTMTPSGVCVAVPHLPAGLTPAAEFENQSRLVDELFTRCAIRDCVLWYYTPMAVPFTRHLKPLAVAYDCMDELSAFRGAPPSLRETEEELLARADVVFTGGLSLYEAKRTRHPNVHAFSSSIDVEHFARARKAVAREPGDQASIPHPRFGFAGVIDERMDLDLVAGVADLRPDWHLVFLGPVVKIETAILPARPNIHYLGAKKYEELPLYMAGWDGALMPFARNEATRYISPTKTPEYLAAGKRVVSTSILDVVRSYGRQELVEIADTPEEFVNAIAKSLDANFNCEEWLYRVDRVLAQNSWGRTFERMMELLESASAARSALKVAGFNRRTPAVPVLSDSRPPKAEPVFASGEQEDALL
jgi:UDP-galactopyranose mutase